VIYGLNPYRIPPAQLPASLRDYYVSGNFAGGTGPLWFAVALLIFSAVLVGGWNSDRSRGAPPAPAAGWPGAGTLAGFALFLVAATFAVRLFVPIGSMVLGFQFCFFPQYIAAFAVGVWIARRQLIVPLATSRVAQRAGWAALVLGPIVLLGVLALPRWLGPTVAGPMEGGWNWGAFGYAAWEQIIGVGLALGTLALFARRFTGEAKLARWMSDRSFAVYVLHPPVLVALTLWFQPLGLNPFAGAALLTVTGLAGSFAAADLARRIPGLKSIL